MLGAVAVLALSAPLPGRAETATVAVANHYVSPKVLLIDPGVTVAFEWLEGRHRLFAYRNASWDSGERGAPFRYEVPFSGGTVRYRCLLHSTMDAAGQCTGMCGILTDDPDLDTRAPTAWIVRPRRGEIVTPTPEADPMGAVVRLPVRIEGTAWDDKVVAGVGIRLWDNLGRPFERVANCPACGSGLTTWWAEVSLLPGVYLVEAIAVDAAGNRFITPRQNFIVV